MRSQRRPLSAPGTSTAAPAARRYIGAACECPGWWLHWSQPESNGKMPSFCSGCGSRTHSRRKVGGASASLRQQLELLHEIVRQQAEDIDMQTAECRWLNDCINQRNTEATQIMASPGMLDVDLLINKAKVDVERLESEVHVWRGASRDSAGVAASTDNGVEGQEEAAHNLERQRWSTERSRLERQIQETKERVRQLEANQMLGPQSELADLASVRAEAAFYQDELAAEKAAVMLARERLTAARQEIDEAQRSQANSAARNEQHLSSTMQEIQLTERRIEVELELQKAQEAQLQSVQTTSVTLKAQVSRAQQELQDLKTSLAQNQEALRRLRQ